MRTLIVLLILISSEFCFAQDPKKEGIETVDSKVCLKFAPMSLLDGYHGASIRIGIEYKLKNALSLYNEIGTFVPNSFGKKNNQGALTKIELKRYLNKTNETSGEYFSVESFIFYQSYNIDDTINLKPKYARNFNVYKGVSCLTFKFGELTSFKCGLTIDAFAGLGIRFKSSHNSLNDEENNNIVSVGDYGDNISEEKAGKFVWPKIDLGVKVGWRLK